MKDDYELFPQKMIEELKYDIEALKKKLMAPDKVAEELMAEIADLREEIKELHNIFQETLADIKEEDSGKLLKIMETKIETVNTQNETIARGMVAISDKLEDFMTKNQGPTRMMPVQHTAIPPLDRQGMSGSVAPRTQAPLPPGYAGGPTVPPPGMNVPRQGMNAPPPAPKPRREGIFK